MTDIPPLQRPEDMPHIATQADLHRRWSTLMGELGFGYPRLYWQFVPPDGSADSLIVELTELPDLPDPTACASLMEVCAQLLDEMPPGTQVALLYARPGGGLLTSTDRAWGRSLTEAARLRGVPMWPIHFADDESLCVLAPDDLTESA
ncbi:MAG: hypothetical protein ACR2HA_01280 [Nocardioides sp.]